MSSVSKLLVKLNPTEILHTIQKKVTPNLVNQVRRNISKRYTIGKDCNPKEPEECPQACRKVKKPTPTLPMTQECIDNKKCGEDRTKPVSDYGEATYNDKNMGDHINKSIVKKPGQYVTDKCDPFPRDEDDLQRKLIRCKPTMRHPCDQPPHEHKCSVTEGKMLYTTNEVSIERLPDCPKGNWNYTDKVNQ